MLEFTLLHTREKYVLKVVFLRSSDLKQSIIDLICCFRCSIAISIVSLAAISLLSFKNFFSPLMSVIH